LLCDDGRLNPTETSILRASTVSLLCFSAFGLFLFP
jgi:hypothetical protein